MTEQRALRTSLISPKSRVTPRVRARAARRLRGAGFTLIELTVALVAGLLVSMALVQVSKEANNTFHEEVRTAAAEMSLRIALERLRNDLQRAAYMSTGNVQGDPMIARYSTSTNNLGNVAVPVPGLSRLAGVRLTYGGSLATAPLSSNANNNLNPDAIDLGGNFSSTDEFVGFMCPSPPGGGGCSGQSICLEQNTPAMWRIKNTGANAAATLQSYFNPSYYTNPTAGLGTTRFMARVTDSDTGHYLYVLTCQGANATTYNAGGAAINIDPNSRVLTTADTRGRGGVAGLGAGKVIVSPVEIVHWQILQASAVPAAGSNGYGVTAPGSADPNEYVLTRQYVDAISNNPDPNTMEVVSEYAVDLKFAFTVDSQVPYNNPPGAYVINPLLYLQLDSITNQAWAYDVSTVIPYSQQGPQRIRSVRVRTAIRTAAADRIVNVTPVPNTGQPYMFRYFIPGAANGLEWARVRTGVTETALPNQARYYW
jgi:hypothetical protein